MELQGRIKVITPVQTFGANGFQKRELIIVTEEQYPQTNPQGEVKYFNSLVAWRIVNVDAAAQAAPAQGQVPPPQPVPAPAPQPATTFAPKAPAVAPQGDDLNGDDLPF